MPIKIKLHLPHLEEVVSDGNYYFDADGNVTTDESKGVRWLARTGANVLPAFREALRTFLDTPAPKPAKPPEPGDQENGVKGNSPKTGKKAAKPDSNKSAAPKENKGEDE